VGLCDGPSHAWGVRVAAGSRKVEKCSLFVLASRARFCGAQLVACEAARRLAVQTHEAEHHLEEVTPRRRNAKE
jgi:hypothetical protein